MVKRVTATNWEVIVRDVAGAIVNIDYECPYCHMATGELINVGAGGVDKIDSSWETDQVCGICGKALVIQCM